MRDFLNKHGDNLLLCVIVAALTLTMARCSVIAEASDFDAQAFYEAINPQSPQENIDFIADELSEVRNDILAIGSQITEELQTLSEGANLTNNLLSETQAIAYYILMTMTIFLVLWLLIVMLKGIYHHLIQVWF
jgi:hypothetical protein